MLGIKDRVMCDVDWLLLNMSSGYTCDTALNHPQPLSVNSRILSSQQSNAQVEIGWFATLIMAPAGKFPPMGPSKRKWIRPSQDASKRFVPWMKIYVFLNRWNENRASTKRETVFNHFFEGLIILPAGCHRRTSQRLDFIYVYHISRLSKN